MQKTYFIVLLTASVMFLNLSCKSSYPFEDAKYAAGKLSSPEIKDLKNLLLANTPSKIQDTIIINYNYNNANCWHNLDQESDEYIQQFVVESKKYVLKNTTSRHKTSFFGYREPGNNVNKKILWDDSIYIDDSLFLKNLLFSKKKSCGNSAIVLPNGDCIIVKDDSHNVALMLSKKEIYQILLQLKNK